MDMQAYVAAIGLWIWAVTGEEAAPFPMGALRDGTSLGHDHDFCLGPIAVISATLPSPDVLERLRTFSGASAFIQVISTSPRRDAHVYLTPDLMMGLETADISYRGTEQYHPLTCHWLSGNRVHWFRLRFKGRLQGGIRDGSFDLTLIPDDGVDSCIIEAGPGRISVTPDQWQGDGVVIQVTTELDAKATESGVELRGIKRRAKLVLAPRLQSKR